MFDLSNCLIDFTLCPAGVKMIDHFPELSAYQEFTSLQDENLIKIAIATADMESPFLKIKDRETMLRSLFKFIGIDVSTDESKALLADILIYKSVDYLNCFGKYLVMLHEIDWTRYQSTKQTHDILTMDSMRPRDNDETDDQFVKRKVNIQNHLENIGEKLKKLEAKIFPDSRSARELAINEAVKIRTYAEKYSEPNTVI